MTFLNSILALGALAFTVPLIIHLLFKRRFRTIDWGAMHLLDSVVRLNRRRIQLLHLLLLLIRCMLPVLLALCLARPVLTGFRALPGDDPQSLILAVDVSRSMSARDALGIARIDRVKQDLGALLGDLSRKDEVILIPSNRLEDPASRIGPQDAVRRVEQLQAVGGPIDISRLLRSAIDAADEASHTQRRIIVVSDFQSHSLDAAAMNALGRLSTSLSEKPIRPVISFLNVGMESDQLANVSVEAIEIDSPAVVAGRTARFSARIRNASDLPIRGLRTVWSIDGAPLSPRTVSIAPRSSRTVLLSRTIDDVGVHKVSLAVEHGDAMIADNERSVAVDVIREIDVLIVDGQPSSRALRGESDFLSVALSPFAFGSVDQPDAVRTKVISVRQIESEIKATGPDVVVLANVAAISAAARQTITRFVSGGGSLVVFDGDTLNTDVYNDLWTDGDDSWNLPASLGEFVGEPASVAAQPLAVGNHNAQYSPWQLLGTTQQRPFGDVEVFGYRKLTLRDANSEQGRAAMVLLSMAGGDPLVVTSRRGRGQVVQFAVPCDTAWTSLPMRMVYVPMMQQLILDLAGSRKQTTIDVGQGFSVPVGELTALLPDDVQPDRRKPVTYAIQTPADSGVTGLAGQGSQREQPMTPIGDKDPRLIVTSTTVPGTYRIRQTTPLKEEHPIVVDTLRVVEVPVIESQLRDADPSRMSAAATAVDANVYADLQSLQADDRTRRYGREIWRWLLIGLLVFMIAEIALQQWSVRTSTVGAN